VTSVTERDGAGSRTETSSVDDALDPIHLVLRGLELDGVTLRDVFQHGRIRRDGRRFRRCRYWVAVSSMCPSRGPVASSLPEKEPRGATRDAERREALKRIVTALRHALTRIGPQALIGDGVELRGSLEHAVQLAGRPQRPIIAVHVAANSASVQQSLSSDTIEPTADATCDSPL
jgi:hypothetical protein